VTTGLPEAPPPGRRRRRWPLLLVALLVTVALAVAGGWWLAVGRYTHAPSVIGLTRSAATTKVEDAGLHAHWLPPVHSSLVTTGKVAVESPHAGGQVARHGTVNLRLSSGPVTHVIPSLQGSTVSKARSALTGLDLTVAKVQHSFDPTIDKGKVIGTSPGAGATVDAGSSVTLIVSKGIQQVKVPKGLAGMKNVDATTELRGLGFHVTHTREYSDTVAPGDVISATPASNTVVDKGSTVALVISRGPQTVDVPNVVGESIADAIKAIKAAGLVPNPHESVPFGPGRVLREDPTGPQPLGTTITLDYF
jgi:serine/threonine-protein kinase